MSALQVNRNQHIDSLKFVLIALVILGHWLAPSRYSDSISGSLYSIIYAFHMPLFVLLSGYFTNVDDLHKLNKRSFLLFETYILIMGVQSLLYRDYHHLLIPENSGWYVLSLMFWGYMTRFIRNLKSSLQIIVAFTVAIIVFQFGLGRYEQLFSIMRTILFFPIFIIGYAMRQKSIEIGKPITKKSSNIALVTVSIIILSGLCYFSSRELHVFEFNRDSLHVLMHDFNLTAMYVYCIKIIMGGVIALLCILFLGTIRLPAIFSVYGKHSLLFYTIQAIIVHFYRDVLNPGLIHALFGTLITIGICCLISKSSYVKMITNPLTYFLKWKI